LRRLIVNADDFGYSRGVNRGIAEAHERGIVTSASLMVDRAAAAEAAEYGRDHEELGVGLHVDLRHWRVRRRPWSLVWSAGQLRRLVASEVCRQLERFRALLGRDPTHLDSHHHRHRQAPIRPIFEADPASITPAALVALLEKLPDGVVELGCHPGYADDLDTWYRNERVQEVEALCDPAVRETIDRLGIELVSFGTVAEARPVKP
jgi:chitin disaccharide deacetylase